MFLVVGPCSIHDTKAALEYAKLLKELNEKVKEKLVLVMRVYFEKPRTTVGWKGLINDPHLNGTYDVNVGLEMARQLLVNIADMGVPIATEALDPLSTQYLSDLVTWSAVGARTTESQTHREMASGLESPVGFKNGTDGGIDVAINAVLSASREHSFIGANDEGKLSIITTAGNSFGHVILRGGTAGVNYHLEDVLKTKEKMIKANVEPNIVIDCSHANSHKDFKKQVLAWDESIENIKNGETSIKGIMMESNLVEGRQDLKENGENLMYGQSITDACIAWSETEQLILTAYEKLTSK